MTNDESEDAARRQRRLQQLRQAQQDRRERVQLEGKVLLQGLVDDRVKKGYRRLKGLWGMDSMGDVMTKLLNDWEAKHGKQ